MTKNKQTMKMAAAIIVLVAAAGVYFGTSAWNRASQEQEAASEDTSTDITSLSSDDVTQFSYVYNGETYTFVKEDGTWYYDADREFPVNQSSIDGKLSSALSTTASRVIEISEDNLSDYGLDEPSNVISFTDSEGNETVFEIGTDNGTTGEYYCRLGDTQTVYMISSSLSTMMSFNIYTVADMESFPSIASDDIKTITVDGGTESRNLDADDDASAFSTISTLSYSAHVDYDCEDMSVYGLDDPQYLVTIKYLEDSGESADETSAETSSEETDQTQEIQTDETEAETEETSGDEEETYDENQLSIIYLNIGDATDDGYYYVNLSGSTEVHLLTADTVSSIVGTSDTGSEESES